MPSPAKRKVIIDQDSFGPGGSNLLAILMALQAPEIEVLGITVVTGDGWLKENVAHALRLLELVDRTDVPVVPGAARPLVNSAAATRRWEKRHGRLPYKGAWTESWPADTTVHRAPGHAPGFVPPVEGGNPTTRPSRENAAAFLVRQVRRFPGEVTILAMGPFTNLALAARLDPGFAAAARELVFMGGSFNPVPPRIDEFALQFLHNPRVEFNCRFDPAAAALMLHAGWKKISCVPLDATTRPRLTRALVRRASAGSASPAARYLARFAKTGFPMWDEIAAAVALDPSLVTATTRVAMDISTDPGASYGATLSWPAGAGPGRGEPDVNVALAIHEARFASLFATLMRRTASSTRAALTARSPSQAGEPRSSSRQIKGRRS